MSKKKSRLQLAQEKTEAAIDRTNAAIDILGTHTKDLYDKLNGIQDLFDSIRNIPSEKRLQYEKLKEIRISWKQQAEKIDSDYQTARIKSAGSGAAGVGAGVAVVALGPSAAMGIATTFGVASTGTAISSLSGAAATNAALAWLGGGAAAAGGGGMAAGNALLALAGPIGWAIAGVALLGSGILLLVADNEKRQLESIFTHISQRDTKSYDLATVEINERVKRITNETGLLDSAIGRIQAFGTDYEQMTEAQQYELGSYVNLMEASTQLLVNPILGLQPRFTEEDYQRWIQNDKLSAGIISDSKYTGLLITLANLLYAILIDDGDKKLLVKTFRNNKTFLSALELKKEDITLNVFDAVDRALIDKYAFISRKAES